jgi:hypothetical protein
MHEPVDIQAYQQSKDEILAWLMSGVVVFCSRGSLLF